MERRHSNYSYKRRHTDSENDDHKVCGIFKCSEEITEMLDCSLARDVIFVLFILSNLLTSVGFNIPYVFLVTKAKKDGINPDKASMLISIIGGANTIGRIILGYLSDKPWINRLYIYNSSLTIAGIGEKSCIYLLSWNKLEDNFLSPINEIIRVIKYYNFLSVKNNTLYCLLHFETPYILQQTWNRLRFTSSCRRYHSWTQLVLFAKHVEPCTNHKFILNHPTIALGLFSLSAPSALKMHIKSYEHLSTKRH